MVTLQALPIPTHRHDVIAKRQGSKVKGQKLWENSTILCAQNESKSDC
jgi:hypothetical protein